MLSANHEATVEALKDGRDPLSSRTFRCDARRKPPRSMGARRTAAAYAEPGDAFVSDGFGVVHRKRASVYDIASSCLPPPGLLVLKEIESLRKATDNRSALRRGAWWFDGPTARRHCEPAEEG